MNRFRTIALLLGMVVLASMTSCTKEEKDGVYTPKKKIQKVYVSSTDSEKYLNQSWDWDGGMLKAINHYDSGKNLMWTETFSYDGNRLVRVDDSNGPEYTIYDYDGKKLKSANYYVGSELEATATYSYNDGKLNKIVLTGYEDAKSARERKLQSSYLPFSTEILEVIDKIRSSIVEPSLGKENDVMELQFSWSGDNVSEIVATFEEEIQTVTFQYDSKNNPHKGFLGVYSFDPGEEIQEGYMFMSKNNITKVTLCMDDEKEEIIINFTYQYDRNDYPTMIVRTWSYDSDDYVTYYEYE